MRAMLNHPRALDVELRDEGTLLVFSPLTDAGRHWCREWLPFDCPRWAGGYVVEHRFAVDIIYGMTCDGLEVGA